MTVWDAETIHARAPARRWPAVAYALTVFASAALLFFLEPMFAKMVLPLLGGSAAVWSVAMVVFQGLLLAGYLYADLLTRFLSVRGAVVVHLCVCALGLVSLPVALAAATPPQSGVSLWLVGLFLGAVGLPCFALSANAPLLQAWFARRGGTDGAKVYWLYRASNLGSFAILLGYPFVVEPNAGLALQARGWSIAYVALGLAIAGCGALAWRAPAQKSVARTAPVAWRDRLAWTALAFVPSGLLVAVTAHIATDVASAPFLWIVPLALYLLTFVLLFADKPVIPAKLMLAAQPVTLGALALLLLWTTHVSWGMALAGHLAVFFVAAMVCHGQLYALRPPAERLTEFYAWMSLGGVLGGIFAALIAPQIFDTVAEYPLLAFAALFARSDVWHASRKDWLQGGLFVLAVAGALTAAFFASGKPVLPFVLGTMALGVLVAMSGRHPGRVVPLAAFVLTVTLIYDPSQSVVYRARSFYGVYKVVDVDGGRFRVLYHGTTAHGAETLTGDTARPEPLTYYYHGGPLGEAITAARASDGGTLSHVAVAGLGVGALSCWAQGGEDWRFYELDPLDVAIARDARLFRSVSRCAPKAPIVLGDARLTLARTGAPLDLLVLDTFSSDSVPTHMLTREAFALYKARLAPHGTIAINISNNHLSLAPVVAASAEANGMVAAVERAGPADGQATLHLKAEIAVIARSRADLDALHLGAGWRIVHGGGTKVWTDDYSAILAALAAKMRE
ncbi:MAG TPA: hypothetical protein VG387_12875 [Rhizomicrobium sp.]|jgi:hypothetical protein|nr:hypothetical protein [Rhizomicrobium sp.]